MSNIDKIKGAGGPTEPAKGSTKKSNANESDFKEFMKVDEVSEVDPEERRNAKQRAEHKEKIENQEAEEPEELGVMKAPPLPPNELNLPERDPSAQNKRVEKKESVKPQPLSLSATPQKKSESLPPPKESKSSELASTSTKPSTPSKESTPLSTPSIEQGVEDQEALPPQALSQPETSSPELPLPPKPQPNPIEQKREAEKKGSLEPKLPPILEEKESYFQQNKPDLNQAQIEESADISSATPQTLPLSIESTPLTTPPLEIESEQERLEALTGIAPSAAPLTPSATTTPPPLPAYTQLSPQIFDLFERMVGVITIMQATTGISETTIHLTSEQFISSIFYGTQIIISEDKNAQNQFNIEINTPPHAAPLLENSLKELRTSFEKGGYNFEIKQMRVNLIEGAKNSFKRKVEDKSKDEEERA